MAELYDTDLVEWSEHQARLLRQVASGKPGNEAPDWANIIEEIESVGRSEVGAIESWWFQALLHGLKCEAWPSSPYLPHWRAEARGFRAQARRRYHPSMRGKLDMPGIYADVLSALPDTMDGEAPQPVPTICPYSLEDMLATP